MIHIRQRSATYCAAIVASRVGCVAYRRARSTGTYVGLYYADEAGIESDPNWKWATVCEEHCSLMAHRTRALAVGWLSHPEEWCEECMAEYNIATGRPPVGHQGDS